MPLDDQQRVAREHEEVLPSIGKYVSASNSSHPVNGRLSRPGRWNHRASRVFMTNQPTVTGTSPASVSVRSASRTTVGCYGTARGVVAPETDYHVRHVWREMNIPWPLGFEQLTPVTIDRQLNIFCRHTLP